MRCVFLLILSLVLSNASRIPCYYHMVEDYLYHDEFCAKTCSGAGTCTVTPFVSPDNSVEAHLLMISEAKNSIIIANPAFSSWISKCHTNSCSNPEHCTGCSIEDTHDEIFPIFGALVEAIQTRNVSVKILTNNYSVPTCEGSTTLLDYLFVNGAEIRMYQTTNFMHAKFIEIDNGKKILLSSVNFSLYSFKKNRETGVILSNCECDELTLYTSVFNYDWKVGEMYQLTNQYTKEQVKQIKLPINNSLVPNTTSSLEEFEDTEIIGMYVGPDYARDTFFKYLNATKHSLIVHIYVINDEEICAKILSLHKQGVKVSVLVSPRTAYTYLTYIKKCYQSLQENGVNIKNATTKFSFSHQKYWIIDDTDIHLSTGNWERSNFLPGYDNKPIPAHKKSIIHANRDMLIVMRNSKLVTYFKNLFTKDGGVFN